MDRAASILLLHGDAEARLLADAESVLQALAPDRELRLARAWATRPDWLGPEAPPPPDWLRRCGAIPAVDGRELLAQPHDLVVLAPLPSVTLPALRPHGGGGFLAHRDLCAGWPPDVAAAVAEGCVEEPPLCPSDAAAGWQPVIERLHSRGCVVALCTAFRHVRESPAHRGREGLCALRETVRRLNSEIAHLSRRTGCFVLDLDRPLAQEGGASLEADCFGGRGRAAEIALDEFAALILDALPDILMPPEVA